MRGKLPFLIVCFGWLTVSNDAGRCPTAASRLTSSREWVAKSESGRYRLDVVRVFREVDVARYRLRRNGKTLWTGERPFFLKGAVVTEEGVVTGFAHTSTGDFVGNLEVIVLDARGAVRSRWATPKEFSRFPDGPENPTGMGVTLARQPERVIVQVSENDLENPRERLWIYRLDGKGEVVKLRFKSAFPGLDSTGDLIATREVNETPLLLCQWEADWYLARFGVPTGSRFQLYDSAGALVWSLNVPGPSYRFTDDVEVWELERYKRIGGKILPCKVAGRFKLHLVARKQEVTYQVRRTNHEWTVTEVARRPYSLGKR